MSMPVSRSSTLNRPASLQDEKTDAMSSASEKRTSVGSVPSPHAGRSFTRDVVLICTVTLVMILNTANLTAVAISLPTIGRELNIVESKLQWIVSAYSLSSGCLLLFLGRIADLYGRKYVFMFGCLLMCVFGLGCGFAQDEITLDVLRGMQGIGAAACIPAALGILAHNFPPSPLRSVAFATFAAGAPVGAAIGAAIGGVLTQLTAKTWRSTFWFLAGLSAVCCLGGMVSIDKDVPHDIVDRRVDWLGALLVTAGLTLIIFVLSDGSIAPNGWKTGYIIALLIVGVLLLVLFVAWQHYLEQLHAQRDEQCERWWTPPPLMSVTIWSRARGRLAVVLVLAFLEWCAFNVFTFWVQLYYQDFVGLTPILTMVRLLPMFVTGVLCNLVVALVVGHVPLVYLITIGLLFTGVANLLFGVIDPAAPFWAFGFPAAIVSVFGADFVFATGTLFVAKVCLPHEQSVGGALFQTLTQVGTAFGVAISTIVFNARMERGAGTDADAGEVRATQLGAYKDAMWSGAAFGFFGAILAVMFLRGVGVVGHREKPKDAESEATAEEGSASH